MLQPFCCVRFRKSHGKTLGLGMSQWVHLSLSVDQTILILMNKEYNLYIYIYCIYSEKKSRLNRVYLLLPIVWTFLFQLFTYWFTYTYTYISIYWLLLLTSPSPSHLFKTQKKHHWTLPLRPKTSGLPLIFLGEISRKKPSPKNTQSATSSHPGIHPSRFVGTLHLKTGYRLPP